MIAALTGRPLLALLAACYVAVVLLLARACGVGGGCPCWLRHDDDPAWWEDDPTPEWTPCGDPACCPPGDAS